MYKSDSSPREISKHFSTSRKTLTKQLRDAGVKPCNQPMTDRDIENSQMPMRQRAVGGDNWRAAGVRQGHDTQCADNCWRGDEGDAWTAQSHCVSSIVSFQKKHRCFP